MKRAALVFSMLLGACMPASNDDVTTRQNSSVYSDFATNPFPVSPSRKVTASNKDIARDFMDLSFSLESGRNLPVFTRFEGPISVRLTGKIPQSLPFELNRLIQRLQDEAKLDIYYTSADQANVNVHAVSRRQIQRTLPMAACFVAPNVVDLEDFKASRKTTKTSWSVQTERRMVSLFIPFDASPQEIRDCLHEEFAQGLGPLNDLYRLPNSVFNDDNIHTILTDFDMMVLRATYAPELRSGMTRAEVAARLPAILRHINPAGEGIAYRALPPTSRAWIKEIQTAVGPGTPTGDRMGAATRALNLAQAAKYNDHRLGFSYFAMGRIVQRANPDEAFRIFKAADKMFRQSTQTNLYAAHTAVQLASYQIAYGKGQEALVTLAPYMDAAYEEENAALLSTLMFLRAEALELTGRVSEANIVRLDSLNWARYGFGSEKHLKTKLREIQALNPLNRRNG